MWAFVATDSKRLNRNVRVETHPETYIWEIWNLDDTFKELFFSGSVEELREAVEEGTAVTSRSHKVKIKLCFYLTTLITYPVKRSRKRSRCPRRTSGAMPENRKDTMDWKLGLTQRGLTEYKTCFFVTHGCEVWTARGQRSGRGSCSPGWAGWEESVCTVRLES